jgi:hypothetical protein
MCHDLVKSRKESAGDKTKLPVTLCNTFDPFPRRRRGSLGLMSLLITEVFGMVISAPFPARSEKSLIE